MYSIAVIDGDSDFLKMLEIIYARENVAISTFMFPADLSSFISEAGDFDILLVDHVLGGTNGANITKQLIKSQIRGKILIISDTPLVDKYSSFTYYINKTQLSEDPLSIFAINGDAVDQAVEACALSICDVREYVHE